MEVAVRSDEVAAHEAHVGFVGEVGPAGTCTNTRDGGNAEHAVEVVDRGWLDTRPRKLHMKRSPVQCPGNWRRRAVGYRRRLREAGNQRFAVAAAPPASTVLPRKFRRDRPCNALWACPL